MTPIYDRLVEDLGFRPPGKSIQFQAKAGISGGTRILFESNNVYWYFPHAQFSQKVPEDWKPLGYTVEN